MMMMEIRLSLLLMFGFLPTPPPLSWESRRGRNGAKSVGEGAGLGDDDGRTDNLSVTRGRRGITTDTKGCVILKSSLFLLSLVNKAAVRT